MESTSTETGTMIYRSLEWFGDLGSFSWKVIRAALTRPFELREIIRQFDEIGSKSLPLVALAGAAVGAVLSLETRSSLVRFGAKSMLPSAILFSIVHEMGPVITGFVVSWSIDYEPTAFLNDVWPVVIEHTLVGVVQDS